MFTSDLALPFPSLVAAARERQRRSQDARERPAEQPRDRDREIGQHEVTAREQWLAAFAHCPFF